MTEIPPENLIDFGGDSSKSQFHETWNGPGAGMTAVIRVRICDHAV